MNRKTIFWSGVFSVSALSILIGAYVASFYVFYHDALLKNASDGPYYVEKGNYRACSILPDFAYNDRDVWPFNRDQFSAFFHPLIWWNMKNMRKSEWDGKPIDISKRRKDCISRGARPEVFDGDLVIYPNRSGAILYKIDYFGSVLIADLVNRK